MLLLTLLLTRGVAMGFAAGEDGETAPEEPAGPVYQDIRIYADGLLIVRGYESEGVSYIPLDRFCAYLDRPLTVSWDEESGLLSLSAYGLTLEASAAEEYFTVNGRYVYDPVGFRMIEGQPCFPAEAAAYVFHMDAQPGEDGESLYLDLSGMEILSGSVTYYSDAYGSDNIFWLSRVIYSEAGHQSMAGRIGVGNVVLNRVESDRFPNNIHDVIFDPGQFEPVYDGHIYREPNEASVAAACLCLDGWNTAGNSLFFIDPRYADDSWLQSSRRFVATLGLHDFYA